MANIILFKGESQYNALQLFTDRLGESFQQMGKQVRTIDFMDSDSISKLQEVLTQEIDFVFSFNGIGIELSLGSDLLFSKLDIPFIVGLVDHPYHHWGRLHTGINQLLVTCVDREACQFLNSSMPMANIKGSAFVPHAGVLEDKSTFSSEISERNIPVLFCGSYQAPDSIFKDYSLSYNMQKLFRGTIDLALANSGEPLPKLAEKVLESQYIYYDDSFWYKCFSLLPIVDRYIRSYKRHQVIRRLLKDGVPIAVCGSGWESFLRTDQLTIYKARSFKDVIALLKQARICLEIDANFAYGGHERPLTAMLNRVPVVASYNDYYKDNFVVDKEIILYSPLERYELSEKLTVLLQDSSDLQEMSKAGHDVVSRNHTYLKMADKILTLVDTYKDFKSVEISLR